MIAEESKTLLTGIVTHLPDLWSKRGDSLIEFSRSTRNDFLTLVERELITLDYLPDILDTAQTFTSGYYLSAVTLLVDIPEINIRRTLDKVATNRDPIESILGAGASAFKYVGTESFEHGLPNLQSLNGGSIGVECFALEADKDTSALDFKRIDEIDQKLRLNEEKNGRDKERHDLEKERSALQEKLQAQGYELSKEQLAFQREKLEHEKDRGTKGVGFGRDAISTIDELSNLSTGKLLEVNFERNGNKASVPVAIRLAVTDTDSKSMRAILSTASIKNTFKERWRRMRNGELAMVKDLLFCHDLISESRRTRVRDKSGFFEHMMRNQSKNFLSGLFSLNPSINNASAIIMVTEETAKAASLELGGSLDKFAIREKVFKSTAAMLLYVVDTKWDTVTIYHRGIDAFTTVTKRDIQRSKGKGGGSQINDIISAYQAGSAPSI